MCIAISIFSCDNSTIHDIFSVVDTRLFAPFIIICQRNYHLVKPKYDILIWPQIPMPFCDRLRCCVSNHQASHTYVSKLGHPCWNKMTRWIFVAKPLSEPMLAYLSWTLGSISVKFESKGNNIHTIKYISKCCMQNGGNFVFLSIWSQQCNVVGLEVRCKVYN